MRRACAGIGTGSDIYVAPSVLEALLAQAVSRFIPHRVGHDVEEGAGRECGRGVHGRTCVWLASGAPLVMLCLRTPF